MIKKYIVFLCLNMLFMLAAYGQGKINLSGEVNDADGETLIGASVYISSLQMGSITNKEGKYQFVNITPGKYTIEVSYIGYKTLTDTINIHSDTVIDIMMQHSTLNLQEVIISESYVENIKKQQSLNLEVVNSEFIKQHLGGSLSKSLERLPGVSSIGIGSGQAKPIIRGLSFNRLVVVENGIKHEGQQWGVDHGLEIDQYNVENVEVIKGPASLMYGSDAIGGVIDIKSKEVPDKNSFGANIDLTGKSNNNLLGSSVNLFVRKKIFYVYFRTTYLNYGDYKVPTDSVDIYSYRAPLYKNNLRNTAGRDMGMHLSFGFIKNKFQSRFYISDIFNKSGMFANAHGLEPRNINTDFHNASSRDINLPFQKSNHLKAINITDFRWEKFKFTSTVGFQRNFRQEWSEYVDHAYMPATFPDTLNFNANLEREFEKYIYSANFKLSYFHSKKNFFALGLNTNYYNNKISGRGFIIPAYKQINLGSYLFMRHIINKNNRFQFGLRYDLGNISIASYNDWFKSPIINNFDTTYKYLERAQDLNKTFSNFSWSVGYIFSNDNWLFKSNIGKSFRMPIAKELAANGVNYHRFSYEIGNANILPETSYQLDLGLEYSSKNFAIGINPFINYFNNYIFLNPTSNHDRLYGNGNQIFYYIQSDVFRFGGEIHFHYQIIKPLQLGLIGEYVYSEQTSGDKKGFSLPFSPPASTVLNINYKKQKFMFTKNPYVSMDVKLAAAQYNIIPPEVPTNGYYLLNLSVGGDVYIKKQRFNISLQIKNLLNKKYFNHISYYRIINVPEVGRNLVLNISIPIKKQLN